MNKALVEWTEDTVARLAPGWAMRWYPSLRSAGLCRYRRKELWFSKPFFRVMNWDDATDTVLHEVAHARTEYSETGHSEEWRQEFVSLGGSGEEALYLTPRQLLGAIGRLIF